MKTGILVLVLIVIVLVISSQMTSYATTYAQHNDGKSSKCVTIIEKGAIQTLCIIPSSLFSGDFIFFASPYLRSLDVAYVGRGINYSGVLTMSMNYKSIGGLIALNVVATLITKSSRIEEEASLMMRVSGRIAYIDEFKYLMYISKASLINRSVEMDITKDVASALAKLKYFDGVERATLSVRPAKKGEVIEIQTLGTKIDVGLYSYLRGLISVCKNLGESEGVMNATLLLSGKAVSATLSIKGNVYRESLAVSCLVPLALDIASAISSSNSRVSKMLSSLEALSILLRFSKFVPLAIDGFIKPLMVIYELFENTSISGIHVRVLGNGTMAALNMTLWGSLSRDRIKNLTMIIANEITDVVPLVTLKEKLLNELKSSTIVIKQSPSPRIATSSNSRSATEYTSVRGGTNYVLYIIMVLLVAQAAIVVYLLVRVWRK